MADGYAQASGRPDAGQPAHGARRRQRDGRDLQRAGEQVAAAWSPPATRSARMITLQANLTNRDATRMPHPLVKWSYEPPRAEDVPLALARATHLAALPPQGPGVRLDPDGRLGRRGRRRRRARRDRALGRRAAPPPDPEAVASSPTGSSAAREPGAGRRSRHRRRAAPGTWRSRWPSASACRCGRSPRRAAGGSASRRAIRTSRASCRRRSGRSRETLEGHDLVLVVGASVFPYYPNIPGPLLPEGAALVVITSDPDEAARAPMGDAIVADVQARRSRRSSTRSRESDRDAARAAAGRPAAAGLGPDQRTAAMHATLRECFPEDGIVVLESPVERRWRCATSCGSRGPAATTSAPAAGSASGSRRRSACSSPSPTGRSSA